MLTPFATAVALSAAMLGAPASATRIAVLIEDPAASSPTRAKLEIELQRRGFEVVSAEISEHLRKVVAPKNLLGTRLPEGLSVFEADAIIAGSASYGETRQMEGVASLPVSLTARVIDLGTGRTTTTIQVTGRGIGYDSPDLMTRGANKAVKRLFDHARFKQALKDVGQEAGKVTLIVQGIPSRDALVRLEADLERALAGAPVREIYYAKGLGKLILGGSKAKSMAGPDIADVISENKYLALNVDEVANTRIVTTYNRARTLDVWALVLEPKVPRKLKKRGKELGRYVATTLASFEFATKAAYQPGQLDRNEALERARAFKAHVLVVPEIMVSGKSTALSIRVIDTKTGRPIYREQKLLDGTEGELEVAAGMLSTLKVQLPEQLTEHSIGVPLHTTETGLRTAEVEKGN